MRFLAFLVLMGFFVAVLSGCLASKRAEPTPPAGSTGPYRTFLAPDGTITEPSQRLLPVNYVATPTRGPANELVIAANPRDPNNLIAGAKDYFLGTAHPCPESLAGAPAYPINVWSGVYWSRDGGKSWANALMPGHPEDDANATHPNRGWPCNSDPVIVFDAEGTAYYSGLGIRGEALPDPNNPCVLHHRSIWLMKSTDGGATWSSFSCVASAGDAPALGGGVLDKQWFAVDGSDVYFTYMNFNPSDFSLFVRHSGDGGATWEPERLVFEGPTRDDPAPFDDGRQFATPAVGPDGTLYLTWRNFGEPSQLYFTRSHDRGSTFDGPRPIQPIVGLPGQFFSGGYRVDSYPVLAVDASSGTHSGNLYVVWSDFSTGDADILLTRSADAGLSWTLPVRINNDTSANGAQQFLPWIAVGPTGDLAVAWMDNRSYANATHLDAMMRVSLDGGATWQPELRLNTIPARTEACFHQSGANFIGDYMGLAASAEALHAFWPDGTGGKCNGVTATIVR